MGCGPREGRVGVLVGVGTETPPGPAGAQVDGWVGCDPYEVQGTREGAPSGAARAAGLTGSGGFSAAET